MSDSLPGLSSTAGAGRPLDRRQWRKRVQEREALELWTKGLTDRQIKNAMNLRDEEKARELRVAGADRWMEEEGLAVNQWRAAMAGDMMEARGLIMEALRSGNLEAVEKLDRVWNRLAKLLGTDAQREGSGGVNITIVGAGKFDAKPEVIEDGEWTEEEPPKGLPGPAD